MAIFVSVGLKFFKGTQETIIYRFVMINQRYGNILQILIFWATFGGEIGVATTHANMGLGPQNAAKIWAHLEDLLV